MMVSVDLYKARDGYDKDAFDYYGLVKDTQSKTIAGDCYYVIFLNQKAVPMQFCKETA